MLFLRKLVFYCFLIFYAIACPLIILYAFGYIFEPRNLSHVVKTGDIHLSTAPPGASVYLNNKPLKEKTPALISQLLPGDYDIAIKTPEYSDYNINLSVEAGSATVRDNIILIPEKWEYKVCGTRNFSGMIPIEDTDFFIMQKHESSDRAELYNYKTDENCFLQEVQIPAQKKGTVLIVGVELERNSVKVLVWGKKCIGIIDLSKQEDDSNGKKTVTLDWIFASGKDIKKAVWVYNGSHALFLDDSSIYLIDVTSPDFRDPEFLFKIKEESNFFYSEDTGTAYYVDPRTESLMSVEIVSKAIKKTDKK